MNKDTSTQGSEIPRLELTNTTVSKIEVEKPAKIEATNRASQINTVETKANLTVLGAETTGA